MTNPWVRRVNAWAPTPLPILFLAALLLAVLLSSSGSALQRLVLLRTVANNGYYGTTYDVSIVNTTTGFSPDPITISVGDTVRWTNNDGVPHTATSDSPQTEEWDSLTLSATDTFSHTFNTPGSYSYFCTIHRALAMSGTVIVLGAPDDGTSLVASSPASVPADGVATSTITVTVTDSASNPLPNVSVTLDSDRPSADTITASSPFTDSSGVVTFDVSSTQPGTSSVDRMPRISARARPSVAGRGEASRGDAPKASDRRAALSCG